MLGNRPIITATVDSRRGDLEGRLKLMTRLTGLIAAIVLVAVSFGARAEPVIDIQSGGVKPMPIAIPEFFGNGPDAQVGNDVARVVSDDLERSGLFAPIDHKAFIQDAASLQNGPRFQDWKLINAQALVSGVAQVARQRPGQRAVPALGRVRRPADGRLPIYRRLQQLAPRRAQDR